MKELYIFLILLLFSQILFGKLVVNPTPDKCIGGRIVGGNCNCYYGYRLYNGTCVKEVKPACIGGTFIGNACKCPPRKRLVSGRCELIQSKKLIK